MFAFFKMGSQKIESHIFGSHSAAERKYKEVELTMRLERRTTVVS